MTTTVRLRVPYITAYAEELVPYRLTFTADQSATDGLRLSYTDPVPQDWMMGVLWARVGLHRHGRPEWKLINTIRQRRCMLRLLCQVCGRSAMDDDGRISWVLADAPGDASDGAGYTNAPPTCAACVPEALTSCPRLRHGAAVCTVGGAEPYGVIAAMMRRTRGGPIEVAPNTVIPLDAFHRLEYALARQLLVMLDDVRPAA
ncbi:hypothetical protein [Nonomuraea sp. B1E8]|uniref:hypothetical protein n=1 Tax=unclassified Nonomuraea TaxID=2593643 RepID=UPI00325F6FC1